MGSYPTAFSLLSPQTDPIAVKTDVLLVPVFQQKKASEDADKSKKKAAKKTAVLSERLTDSTALSALDKAMSGHIEETLLAENFKGECGKRRLFRTRKSDKVAARWVVVVGLGPADKLDLAKATRALTASLKETFTFEGMETAAVVLPELDTKLSTADLARAGVYAATQATYQTAQAAPDKQHALKQVSLLPLTKSGADAALLEIAQKTAQAESLTKDLANMPANLKMAQTLADTAQAMASLKNIQVDVISDLDTLRREMPAFWAVAQGAAEVDPPRFIRVSYQPVKALKQIALVGKGVIFDTGGVQVKPNNSMNDMKFDMTGAATVLSAVRAVAELGLKNIGVTAYVAATKNLTGETAYLPDSIIDSANGKKIEIRHTDAEGRVTLADAVHRATLDKPDEMVTIATLTGSAAIAVGHCIALMGTDDDLLNRFEQAAKAAGETVQKLELLEMDFDDIKSDRDAADLSNTGKSRNRGHLSAGAFVVSFAGDIPCAHLDIAGGDAKDGNATGIAVKGVLEYLLREDNAAAPGKKVSK